MQIWDAAAGKKLSVLEGHTARVGEDLASPAAALPPALAQALADLLSPCRGAGLERRPAVIG